MSRTLSATSAHAVLEYIITRAVTQGVTGTSEVTLPLMDLVDPEGPMNLNPDERELSLKITFKTTWVEAEEDLVMIDDGGECDGSDEAAGSDSQGH